MSATDIAERYIQAFTKDMERLGVAPPDFEPRATEHIPSMVEMIQGLIDKGYAYETDGDVYFAVREFGEYGRLSGKNLDELESGARVEVNEQKRDPLDFTLWESGQAWRAKLGIPLGGRTSGLAYRMLGHVPQVPWEILRHSRRRNRSHLSSPRERAGPILRLFRRRICAILVAQRDGADSPGENVEIHRELFFGEGHT